VTSAGTTRTESGDLCAQVADFSANFGFDCIFKHIVKMWGKGYGKYGKSDSNDNDYKGGHKGGWNSPSEHGGGASSESRWAYAQLYREREKIKAMEEAAKAEKEKAERAKELADLRTDMAKMIGKPQTMEDTIMNSMINSPSKEEHPKDRKNREKGISDGMASSLWKLMQKCTGTTKDATPPSSSKKKRKASASSSSASA
jgi:hypothetical protein